MTTSIFETGTPLDIAGVLANKDRRAAFQREALRADPHQTLLAIKLNIPGPIKNNAAITQLFKRGVHEFRAALAANGIAVEQLASWGTVAGNELFLRTTTAAATVKQLAATFEDTTDLGRIFDVDVLDGTGHSWSRTELGAEARRCFICNRPAKECARSRRHSVADLQAYIDDMYHKTFDPEEGMTRDDH
ncbi:citrate lyase holo-[acyl-carrier protein] synthase [Levilactobacillus koreensis]|nr:citrate lyase holo-[acyl-carrier protein] synthase [Levilactobacillus koreensis]